MAHHAGVLGVALPVKAGPCEGVLCHGSVRVYSDIPAFSGLRKAPLQQTTKAIHRSLSRRRQQRQSVVCPKAVDLDSDTLAAVGVALAGVALGIAVPVFYEVQTKNAETRENDQPCFPCKGTGAQSCRFCLGTGSITVELGANETEVSKCVNCEGAGSITCTTCQGSGVQPRYLDRREYKDDD